MDETLRQVLEIVLELMTLANLVRCFFLDKIMWKIPNILFRMTSALVAFVFQHFVRFAPRQSAVCDDTSHCNSWPMIWK